MQSRIGPNRAGAAGFFVWIADAVKLLLKEDLIPAEADSSSSGPRPTSCWSGFALTFVVLPFGESADRRRPERRHLLRDARSPRSWWSAS